MGDSLDIGDKFFYKVDKKTGKNRIGKFKVGIIEIIIIFIRFLLLVSFASMGTIENGNYPTTGYENSAKSYLSKPSMSESEYKRPPD